MGKVRYTNEGNMILDLELYGFGDVIDDGYAMTCSQAGTIPVANEFFDINVSNNTLDYKTALSGFDLVMNDRKEAYLLFSANDKKWIVNYVWHIKTKKLYFRATSNAKRKKSVFSKNLRRSSPEATFVKSLLKKS